MSTPPRTPTPLEQELAARLSATGAMSLRQRDAATSALAAGGGHWTWRLVDAGVSSASIRAVLADMGSPNELPPPPATSAQVNSTLVTPPQRGTPLPPSRIADTQAGVAAAPVDPRWSAVIGAAMPSAPMPLPVQPAPPAATPVAETQVATTTPARTGVEPAGGKLGPYTLEQVLGQGGMATVWLGRHVDTDKRVAIKLMLPHLAQDASYVQRFRAEAEACIGLDHQNLVGVLSHGEDGGRAYMVFEFVDGGTVEHRLQEVGSFPWPVVVELGCQLLEGLAHAHEHGIVHRDLKPANLLLSSAGVLKVGDFGVAKQQGAATLTRAGSMVGTPMYMSPEMAAGRAVDARGDLYTVGVILREFLTGSNPFFSEQLATSIGLILGGGIPTLFAENPCVPAALDDVVERLMNRSPERRYPDGRAVLAALAPLRAEVKKRFPELASRFVRDATGVCTQVRQQLSTAYVEEAQELLKMTHAERPASAFRLYCALRLQPEHPAALRLFPSLCAQEHYAFDAPADPRVLEVQKSLLLTGDTPPALQQLAQLLRAQGQLHLCADAWRRYLLLRPDDGFARNQLLSITREAPTPPPPPSAPRPDDPGATLNDRPIVGLPEQRAAARGLSQPVTHHVDAPRPAWHSLVVVGALALGGVGVHQVGKRIRRSAEQSLESGRAARAAVQPRPAVVAPAPSTAPRAERALCQGAEPAACLEEIAALEHADAGSLPRRAWLLKGRALLATGQPQAAVDVLTTLVDEHAGADEVPEALLRRAAARRMLADGNAALEDVGRAVALAVEPSLAAEIRVERAELLLERSRRDDALADLRAALPVVTPTHALRARLEAAYATLGIRVEGTVEVKPAQP